MSSSSPAQSSSIRREELLRYLGIFIFALSVRLIFLTQIKDDPVATVLMVDARTYDRWAQQIAEGNWLGDRIFYQAPLYPYFLAANYKLFGHSLFSVRVVQIILGAASCVLLALAGRSFFSPRVGIFAGVVLALYPPALFFDCLIQKSALDLFFTTLLLFLLGQIVERQRAWLWTLTGIALACLTLTRENALVLFPVVGAWIFIQFRSEPWKKRALWFGLFALGMALMLVPVGLRNKIVGDKFVLTSSQFGRNFYYGNNESATGLYSPLLWGRGTAEREEEDATRLAEAAVGRKMSANEVSSYWTARTFDYIRANPGHWLTLIARKWYLICNAVEVGDPEDLATFAEYSSLLRGLRRILHFGVIFPFAVLGVVATWNQRSKLWLLYAVFLTLAASVTLFFVFARYKFPLVPVVMLFAVVGLNHVVMLWRERRYRRLALHLALVVAVGAISNLPVLPDRIQSAHTHYNLGVVLMLDGRTDEALGQYRSAIQKNPDHERAHYNLGIALASKGRIDEAMFHYAEAARVKPDFVEAQNNLGQALISRGRIKEAIDHYTAALRIDPTHAKAHYNLAVALEQENRIEEAISHYGDALRLKPDYAEAHNNLGLLLVPKGELEEAVRHFSEAVRIKPGYEKAHFNLGLVQAARGNTASAIAECQRALELARASGQTNLAEVIQQGILKIGLEKQ